MDFYRAWRRLLNLPRVEQLVQAFTVLLAVWFTGLFLYLAARNLNYPFLLSWMEGGAMDTVARLREGLAIYTRPSIEYIPYSNPPFYYYVTSALSYVTGLGFWTGRLVSILSTLGTVALIITWLRREGATKVVSILTVGLFIATYRLSNHGFDIARADMLMVFLSLLGATLLIHGKHVATAAAAGLIFALACFTRQAAVFIVVPLVLFGLFEQPRRYAIAGAVTVAASIVAIILLNQGSEGWFGFYVFELPYYQSLDLNVIFSFWRHDLLRFFVPMLLVAGFYMAQLWRGKAPKRLSLSGFALGLILSAYAGRIQNGGEQVLMPMSLGFALFAGLGIAVIQRKTAANPDRSLWCMLLFVLCAQFYLMNYKPWRFIPSRMDYENEQKFLDYVSEADGEVLSLERRFVQRKIEKKSYGLDRSYIDFVRAELPPEREDIRRELGADIEKALADKRFSAVITPGIMLPGLHDYFVYKGDGMPVARDYPAVRLKTKTSEIYEARKKPLPPRTKKTTKKKPAKKS